MSSVITERQPSSIKKMLFVCVKVSSSMQFIPDNQKTKEKHNKNIIKNT